MLDQHDGGAFAAQRAQQVRQRLLLQPPQSGRRLVQHHEDGIGGERPRHFQEPLLAERQIARELAEPVGKSHAIELPHGLATP